MLKEPSLYIVGGFFNFWIFQIGHFSFCFEMEQVGMGAPMALKKQKPPSLNLKLILTINANNHALFTEDLTEETLTRTDIEQLFIDATKPKQNLQPISN